jgi:predicted Rossmann fold nucleotide-binding protein DprA/Smf involved in DNA uptake
MTNIAVVGSRTFNNYLILELYLDKIIKERNLTEVTIISGGAIGADMLGELYASKHDLPLRVFYPDWKSLGKSAGYIRNKQIVEASDLVVAFHQNNSKGTQHTIDLAKEYGLEVIVIN